MTDPRRPHPDALLARVTEEEAKARRGRLKIFFGASPGVGKTYAMLEEARVKRREGVDVVVGVVETHGRAETAALAAVVVASGLNEGDVGALAGHLATSAAPWVVYGSHIAETLPRPPAQVADGDVALLIETLAALCAPRRH